VEVLVTYGADNETLWVDPGKFLNAHLEFGQ
jgi:hypothetical protein